MAWWMEAMIEAAPYVYNGVTSYIQGQDQAGVTAENALYNSVAINQAGESNAKSILAMGAIQAGSDLMAMRATNLKLRAVNTFNAEQRSFLGDYNSKLLEDEAMLVWEGANLDLRQMETQHAKSIGDIRVAQAASGALIDQDTPAAAVRDAEDQQALERFIVRRSADIQMSKLLDRAAMSRWEGNMEASKIMFEGKLLEASNYTNANLKAFGVTAQSTIDAERVLYNANVQSQQTLLTGSQKSYSESYGANSALTSGLFGAGTTIASSYLENAAENEYSSSFGST